MPLLIFLILFGGVVNAEDFKDIYMDEYGLMYGGSKVVFNPWDRGDAVQRTYMYHSMRLFKGEHTGGERLEARKALRAISNTDGWDFVRHPEAKFEQYVFGWQKLWTKMRSWVKLGPTKAAKVKTSWPCSRDQMIPLMIFSHGERPMARMFWNYYKKRLGLGPDNTDFLFPQHWTIPYRAIKAKRSKWNPLLWIGDTFLFISIWLESRKKQGSVEAAIAHSKGKVLDTSNKINLALMHYFASHVSPTWISKRAHNYAIEHIDYKWTFDYYFEFGPGAKPHNLYFNRYFEANFLETLMEKVK